MKYALLIYDDETTWANATPEEQAAIYAEHSGLGEKLAAKKAFVAGEQLAPTATATTVRTARGASVLTDGPFAELKEHLTGFYLIEADSLDEAIGYAKTLSGTVEVRPCVAH
jgi:hypothetical protein